MTAKPVRLDWPDVAKGLSILGVVILHVSLAVPEGMDTVLAQVNRLLDPLRMPLFFLVSGFFSAKVFRFTLGELFLRRLWFFIVPYVIWAPIELWLKFREYHMFDGSPMPGPGGYLEQLLVGKSMYWFLFALVMFNLVLWATRRLPAWAGVLVGFAPILILPLHTEFHMIGKAVLYLPAFLIGAHLRHRINTYAAGGVSLRNLSFSSLFYVGAFTLSAGWAYLNSVAEVAVPWLLPGADVAEYIDLRLIVNSLVQLATMPMAIVVAIGLSRTPVVSDVLRFLGRHTLVIYLGHPLALTVLYHYNVRGMELPISRDADTWINSTGVWMIVGLVISAIGSVALWLVTRVPYLRWTIMPPRLPVGRTAVAPAARTAVATPAHEPGATVPGRGGTDA